MQPRKILYNALIYHNKICGAVKNLYLNLEQFLMILFKLKEGNQFRVRNVVAGDLVILIKMIYGHCNGHSPSMIESLAITLHYNYKMLST